MGKKDDFFLPPPFFFYYARNPPVFFKRLLKRVLFPPFSVVSPLFFLRGFFVLAPGGFFLGFFGGKGSPFSPAFGHPALNFGGIPQAGC